MAIIPEALVVVIGTELDTDNHRNRLARLDAETQRRIAQHLRGGNVIAARVTLTTAKPSAARPSLRTMSRQVRRELDRIDDGWMAAGDDARERFLLRLAKRGDLKGYQPCPREEKLT